MYRQVLHSLWSGLRLPVVLLALVAFALPLLTVTFGGNLEGAPTGRVAEWLYAAQQIGVLIPGLALVAGLLLGLGAWMHDHAGKHVYALSLPVSRERYVWLRFAAGATLVLVPAAGMLAGALIATVSVRLPSGVHAYPVALTARFLMAALACYAIFFAIAISTRRAAVAVLGLICGVLLADLLLLAIGVGASVTPTVLMWLSNWPGPLAILMGRWALFDV